MVKVFISHSMKDSQLVRVLVKNLEVYNVEAYIAERDSQPGKQLSLKIMQNIDTSDYFLVVYTYNGKDSHFVREEIGYWMGKNKDNNLIPFVEKGINPEAFLCGVEYIEFNPLKPELAIANTLNYINNQIKMNRKQFISDVSVGLGFLGLVAFIFYGLYKIGKE